MKQETPRHKARVQTAALWRRCQIHRLHLHQLFPPFTNAIWRCSRKFQRRSGLVFADKTSKSGTEMSGETWETFGWRPGKPKLWAPVDEAETYGEPSRVHPKSTQHLVRSKKGLCPVRPTQKLHFRNEDTVASVLWGFSLKPLENVASTAVLPKVDPLVNDVITKTVLPSKYACCFHLIDPLISRTLNKHAIQHTGSHCWARQILKDDRGRRGQVTRTEPLNRGCASGQKREMIYIKVSILDVWLLPEMEKMLAAN